MDNLHPMKKVAKTFELTPRALRFYEEKGLISLERDKRNRIYSQTDINRLRLILKFKGWGFSLDEIRDLLENFDDQACQYRNVDELRNRLDEQVSSLTNKKVKLEKSIADIQTATKLIENNFAFK